MVSVSVVGASGYTGGELLKFLLNHPEVDIKHVTSRKNDGEPIHKIHPHLRETGLVFEDKNVDELDSDVVFTATPHGASMNIVPSILESGSKVIDFSGDYRFNDINVYEKWYNLKHTGELDAVYGLPEIHRDEIKKANLIANPGCFTTGAILSIFPLSKLKLLDRTIFDSKTGVSGSGVNPTESSHFPNISQNVNPYKIISHRHTPEIRQELGLFSDIKVSFTPHLVPSIRGILTTSHSFFKEDVDVDSEEIRDIYTKQYNSEPFVHITDEGEIPRLSSVRGSNHMHIGCFEIDDTDRLVIVSAIDNLVKGASGQAVQNLNIICGFDEMMGLNIYGMHP